MTKNIHTLVEDIYSVLSNGVDIKSDHSQELLDTCLNGIRDTLEKHLKTFDSKQNKNYLRPSNLGQPDRKLYYSLTRKEEAKPLDGKVSLKFLYGHLIEEVVLLLARLSGHTIEGEQDEVSLGGVKGSRDCVIDGETVDVKTTSNYAFNKFKNNTLAQDDPFGYVTQLSFYTQGDKKTKQDVASFLAVNKETGEICLTQIDEFDFVDTEKRIKDVNKLLKEPTAPERCYEEQKEGTAGNKVIHKQCNWCQYKHECFKDINNGEGLIGYKYSTGIKWFTEVVKEPRVEKVIKE